MVLSALRGLTLASPCESDFSFADGKVAVVDHLGDDVDTVLKLKVDEVRRAIFDFVKSRFFTRGALDISEGVVVVDRRNKERFLGAFLVQ